MSIKISAINTTLNKTSGALLFFKNNKVKLTGRLAEVDKVNETSISKALKQRKFKGKKGTTFVWQTPHLEMSHVLVTGVGEGDMILTDWRKAGIAAFKKANAAHVDTLNIVAEEVKCDKTDIVDAMNAFAEGVYIAAYKFDKYLTGSKKTITHLKKVVFVTEQDKRLTKKLDLTAPLMEGQYLSRDLVNLPPNVSNPDYMVKTAKTLTKDGVKVKVLGEKELEKNGMNCMLAVGRAAKQESRLIIMKYMGDKTSKKVSAVVGKGVMFDTGGYNLKPSAGMEAMKADMAGAAAVMGTMKALAKRKAKVNVIGVCGCVMNMVSGDGFLPSDILTSYSGKTVEIGNTDAEGRLVLCDAMSYIIDKESPDEILDIATLTGACVVALGGFYGGLFSNDDKMAEKIMAAGSKTGERFWRLPIDDGYAAPTKVADLSNNGSRWGGASTAAVFLKNFNGGLPWAHLDIAGVGMAEKIPGSADVEGATGFGVRTLVNYFEG